MPDITRAQVMVDGQWVDVTEFYVAYPQGWEPYTPFCTCITDPYTCPQGQALAQAIHDRKTAQGDG